MGCCTHVGKEKCSHRAGEGDTRSLARFCTPGDAEYTYTPTLAMPILGPESVKVHSWRPPMHYAQQGRSKARKVIMMLGLAWRLAPRRMMHEFRGIECLCIGPSFSSFVSCKNGLHWHSSTLKAERVDFGARPPGNQRAEDRRLANQCQSLGCYRAKGSQWKLRASVARTLLLISSHLNGSSVRSGSAFVGLYSVRINIYAWPLCSQAGCLQLGGRTLELVGVCGRVSFSAPPHGSPPHANRSVCMLSEARLLCAVMVCEPI